MADRSRGGQLKIRRKYMETVTKMTREGGDDQPEKFFGGGD